MGGASFCLIAKTCARREEVGAEVPIYIHKMDVKGAFRRVPIEWDKASICSYVVCENIVTGFRLTFGWRSSPGWCGLMAAEIINSHRKTVVNTAAGLPHGRRVQRMSKFGRLQKERVQNVLHLVVQSCPNYRDTQRRKFTLRYTSTIC